MFSPQDRARLSAELVAAARADERITAAASVGSAAARRTDAWSDIDLAFRLAPDLSPVVVAEQWTVRMYGAGAVAHTDVWAGPALYRVFLLRSTLQVDLSFWPAADFRATSGNFRLLFGSANEARPSVPPDPEGLVGLGWLYALHVRSSISRGRPLQAVYLLNNLRDQLVALACLRHDLPTHEGRGVDDLPADVVTTIAGTVPTGAGLDAVTAAFTAAAESLLVEARHIDPALAAKLQAPVRELVRTATAPSDVDR